MSAVKQGWIGLSLAALIMAAWVCLHVLGVFFLDLTHPPLSILLSILWIAGLTWLSVGMYIVAHDAMHGSLWPANRKGGEKIGALAVWLYAGFSFQRLLPRHHSHHRHPGSVDDPDFAPDTPSRALAWYGRFLTTYFGLRETVIMLVRVSLYMLLGAKVENIVLFFALPGILSSFQLFYFGTFLPHRHSHGADQAHFADRHNTRSNEFGYLLSLLTCFHFGYHHEHHVQPGMPWWRLPAARRK
ncbi:MAG: fatty acid desaturase [Bdellovibrionales bacterium]|nr:fatty acid desaturase [Massilia sp.]